MTAPSVTNTFVANTTAQAAQVNTNFSDLVQYLSNRNDGTDTWDRLLVTSSSAVPLIVNNSTGTANIANFQDNGTNVVQIVDGGQVYLNATKRLYFDGGVHTYIAETSNDILDSVVGGTAYFRVNAGATRVSAFSSDFTVDATFKIYFDGGGDTYITQSSANIVDFYAGGVFHFRINDTASLVQVFSADFSVASTQKIYLDSASNTYITEASADQIDFVTGGTLALSITSAQILDYRLATIAVGGGSSATLGTIGGSGPATAGQNSWIKVKIAGTDSYIPIWR